ncbi:MAG: hypothetical protein WCB27_22715 [Thermoguttaceae bacterium]
MENERIAESQKIRADKQRDAAELEAYIANITLAMNAMENHSWQEAHRRLDACPASKRGFEWKFLSAKVQGIVVSFGSATDVTPAPGGRLLVTNTNTGDAWLCDMAGNSVGRPMKIPNAMADGEGHSYSCQLEGELIVAQCGGGKSQIWNLDGKPVCGAIKTGPIGTVCSPDSKRLITLPDDRTVLIQDISGQPVGVAMEHSAPVSHVAFSPDSRFVLTGAKDGTARLWNINGSPVGRPMQAGRSVHSVEFSPNGQYLATVSDDRVVRIWTLACEPVGKRIVPQSKDNGRLLGPIIVCFDPIFTPDSRMVLAGSQVWDIAGNLLGRQDELYPFGFSGYSPGRQLRVTCTDSCCTIQLRGPAGKPVGRPIHSEVPFTNVAFSPDGKLLLTTSLADEVAQLWDLDGRPAGEPMSGMSASFMPGGAHVLTDGYICDLHGKPVGYINVPGDVSVDPLGDNLVLTSLSYDGTTPLTIRRITGTDSPTLDFNSDMSLALEEARELAGATGQTSPFTQEAASVVAAARVVEGSTVEVTASKFGKIALHHDETVTAAAASPVANRAAAAIGRVVHFWDLARGREVAEIPAERDICGLQFTADGTELLITFADGSVQIWDSRTYDDRQRDRDTRFREFKPARQYVDRLLTTGTPTKRLAGVIRRDSSLNAIQKVQALAWLKSKLAGIEYVAKEQFDAIVRDKVVRSQVVAAAQKESKPAIRLRVLELANDSKAWPTAAIDAVRSIVFHSDQPQGRYRAAADATDELLPMKGVFHVDRRALETLSGACYRVARYEDAIQLSRRALAIQTNADQDNVAFAWCWIAMSRFKLGQVKEARWSLESATAAAQGADDAELSGLVEEATTLIKPATSSPAATEKNDGKKKR